MTVYLTDDEIVAVCGLLGQVWPYPLPTVDTQSDEISTASRRGVRSLTVRDLVGFDTELDGPGINPDVAEVVSAVTTGKPLLVSGVINENGEPLALGSAAYVVETENGSAVFATATSTGIHALAFSGVEEAREAFVALVDNALVAGIAGGDEMRLLALQAGHGEQVLAVRRGEVTVGSISESGVFEPQQAPARGWDKAALNTHLAA